ncbi:MAG TPA: hypothetical protein VNE39_13195 [Planctomycetota bacterium]|nr:hypothetical protein [Planctomycetota bacterium]
MATRVAGIVLALSVGALGAAGEFQVLGIGGGGGMFTPAASPYDPGLILMSCDMSGSYRSLDGGKHWEMIHWSQLHSSLNCRPLFTPDAIYWVCGSELRVSRDKAKTWTPVVAGKAPWTGAPTRLAASKSSLFVGTDAGLWRSPDGGKTWAECQKGKCYAVLALGTKVHASVDLKYFVSSDDGATWQPVAVPLFDGRGFMALAGGGTRLFGVVFKVGILKSDDEGKTWALADQFRDCNDIHMASNQTGVAYAVQEGRRGEQGVWRTRDGGKTWENCFRMTGPKANVERSWVQTEIRWGYYITPLGFGINPADPKVAMVTTQGDIYITRDGGESWEQAMNTPAGTQPDDGRPRFAPNSLEVTSCWQYLFDPFERNRRYIAYTDIGFARSLDADKTWSWAAKGCPWSNTFYSVVFDPAVKGKLYAATSNRHDIPHWTHTDGNKPGHAGGVCVTEDHARSWRVLGTGQPKLPCTWLCLDPKTTKAPLTFYATFYEGGVYKSTDTGQTWVQKSEGLGNPGNLHAYMVKVHPKTGDVFCSITAHRVGGRDFPVPGGLWKSTDGGESWADLTKTLGLKWPGGFALHPDDPNLIYLTAGTVPGGPQGGVYKTTDGGKSWTRLIGDADFAKSAPPGYVHCFYVNLHPDKPDWVYAGTVAHGLWLSQDAGKTWKRFDAIPFRACQNVAFDPEDRAVMYVTTFGGGVWKGADKPE